MCRRSSACWDSPLGVSTIVREQFAEKLSSDVQLGLAYDAIRISATAALPAAGYGIVSRKAVMLGKHTAGFALTGTRLRVTFNQSSGFCLFRILLSADASTIHFSRAPDNACLDIDLQRHTPRFCYWVTRTPGTRANFARPSG